MRSTLCVATLCVARLKGLPIDLVPCSYSLQLWNPIIKGLQGSRGWESGAGPAG